MSRRLTAIILYVCFFIYIFAGIVSAAIPASERAALIALYNSTNGDNWKDNSGWKDAPLAADGFAQPGTEHQWEGILVQNEHVTQIDLYNNGLTGVIPVELQDLLYLDTLIFQYNSIGGAIPPQMGNITSLKKLDLYGNQLTGTIPSQLENLVNLEELQLSSNKLSGVITPQLGNLPKIIYLYISGNDFEGTIPPELGKLSTLKYLHLSENNLTGAIPLEICDLQALVAINLANNQLEGNILPQLESLKNLKLLRLCSNNFTGTIPPQLGNLSSLTSIDLSTNNLEGSMPVELSNLSNLEYIHFGSNNLTGSIPVSYKNLTNLKNLYLFQNNLSGGIPPELGELSNLEALSLQSNPQMTGPIPPQLGNLSKLTRLMLYGNRFTGTIPPEICNLTSLKELWLYGNKLEGAIPDNIGNLVNLEQFLISGNAISGEVPESITRLTKLQSYSWATTFRYNKIYSNDLEVKAFIAQYKPDWEKTQTITPTGLAVQSVSASSVTLTWTPILYTGDRGGYEVYYSTASGGPWTYSGITADKTVSSYEVTGLLPGTTYYFKINARTETHYFNKNVLVSPYSTEVTGTTQHPAGAYGLSVQSTPVTGVAVTVSPADYYGNGSGETNFGRIYNAGTVVALIAPAASGSMNFSHWLLDNVTYTDTQLTVTMNASHTAVAVYLEPPGSENRVLTVQSSPDSGVTVTVSPADNNGDGTGITTFTRIYEKDTTVTLTAPSESGGKEFLKWVIDSVEKTGRTVLVNMDTHHTAVAMYKDSTPGTARNLTVHSTHGMGAPITVSPADLDGQGNGKTRFSRRYNTGTSVSLTAPATHNGKKFAGWKIDGQLRTNDQTITFTIEDNHHAVAFYVTSANPGLVLSRGKVNFGYIIGDPPPAAQVVRVTINGEPAPWTATADVSWLSLSPASGNGTGPLSLSVEPSGLGQGRYTGTVTVSAPGVPNSPQEVKVILTIYPSRGTAAPIGDFSTPFEGAEVSSSVPVTGWVVDDIGVEKVEIFREENGELKEVGDAVFVEGARPDIEELYPDYPLNHQAGWGYMLLTNFLPGGGNGTYVLHAVATDAEGNTASLGTRTIHCDNANAAKPFGAIDSPDQGGIASGDSFINWGWALTPPPNFISTDGSTIKVLVDGVYVGNPVYNLYRKDIAGLFPGYANKDGSAGYFELDTTAYSDGIHTISWIVVDSAGNKDGIGSRYFIVDNNTGDTSRGQSAVYNNIENNFNVLPPLDTIPRYLQENRAREIPLRELEPLALDIASGYTIAAGYMLVGNEMRPLPVGSSLDRENARFYWQPCIGFVGAYRFMFVLKSPGGEYYREFIEITISP